MVISDAKLESYESLSHLGIFFESYDFHEYEIGQAPVEYDSKERISKLIIERGPDLISYEREVYHVLMYISDCGGLYSGLLGIFSSIIYIITSILDFSYESHLIKGIFREQVQDEKKRKDQSSDEPQPEKSRLVLPRVFLPFCYDSKKRRMMEIGRKKIDSQLEVTNFLVRYMMLWQRLKQDVSLPQRRVMRNSKRFIIDPDTKMRKTSDDFEFDFDGAIETEILYNQPRDVSQSLSKAEE